jgi:AcrR family transcriptional regulator
MTLRPTRRNPRQQRAQATVEAVLEAAAQILEAKGMEGASTNAIATRAGVSVGSLYQYFPNKEALLLALHERHVLELEQRMAAAFAEAEALPLEAAVRLLLRHLVTAYQTRPGLQRVLVMESARVGGAKITRAAEEVIIHQVRAFLEARGEVAHGRPDRAAFMIVHAVEALAHAAAREGALGDRVFHDELVRMVMGYLRAQ